MARKPTKDTQMIVEVVRYSHMLKLPLPAGVEHYRKGLRRACRSARKHARSTTRPLVRESAEKHVRRLQIAMRRVRKLQRMYASWRA